MSLLLQLLGGREIRLDVDAEEWLAAFENALSANEVVKVRDPSDGGELVVNPRLVLYWKVEPDSSPESPGPTP